MTLLYRSSWPVGTIKDHMMQLVENLRTWSQANKMIINLNKSKEMVLGSLAKQPRHRPALSYDTVWCYWTCLYFQAAWYNLCKSCFTALLPETVKTRWVTFWWLTVFLFDGKTCNGIWLCSLAPWLKCCTIPKTGVFAQYDMPYDSACEYVRAQSLSARSLNWGGGSFARSQYPTSVYMTFFSNDEIRKFFSGFDGTLSIQYHELKLINNSSFIHYMPWRNINNLTK